MSSGSPVPVAVQDPSEAVPILARSEGQAMDWSLVLASQGIEVRLDRMPDSSKWILFVSAADATPAFAAIRQYRLENRRFSWRKQLPVAKVAYHAGALLWVFALLLIHVAVDRLRPGGAFDSVKVHQGEWWRAFTAVWLHSDLGHLTSNAAIGLVVLGLAMAQYGAGWALLIGLLAGAAGNAVSLVAHPQPYIGLGASGLVMGAVGMLAARAISWWQISRHATRFAITSFLAGGFLFVLLGTDPRGDVAAHAGGLVAGFALGAIVTWKQGERLTAWAMALFWALVIGTWVLAQGSVARFW